MKNPSGIKFPNTLVYIQEHPLLSNLKDAKLLENEFSCMYGAGINITGVNPNGKEPFQIVLDFEQALFQAIFSDLKRRGSLEYEGVGYWHYECDTEGYLKLADAWKDTYDLFEKHEASHMLLYAKFNAFFSESAENCSQNSAFQVVDFVDLYDFLNQMFYHLMIDRQDIDLKGQLINLWEE